MFCLPVTKISPGALISKTVPGKRSSSFPEKERWRETVAAVFLTGNNRFQIKRLSRSLLLGRRPSTGGFSKIEVEALKNCWVFACLICMLLPT